MPFVQDAHKCQPPLFAWLYRMNTVWKCPKCSKLWRMEKSPRYHDDKKWTEVRE